MSSSPTSRPGQPETQGMASVEKTPSSEDDLSPPNSGSVHHHHPPLDAQSQSYTYQAQGETIARTTPKQFLDLPTDVLHIIIYEVSMGLFPLCGAHG